MWLARSLLPPLLSHLRSPTSACGSSSRRILSLSRAYNSAAGSSSSSNRPHLCSCFGANQLGQRRQDLYVVLDDWKNGFSLYKLRTDDLIPGGDTGMEPRRLPEPILRLGFIMVGSKPRFHTLGSNIVVTTAFDYFGARGDGQRDRGLTLVYDTETAMLHTEHPLPLELGYSYHPVPGSYHPVATGNKLYAFSPCGKNSSLLYLSQTKCDVCSRYGGGRVEEEDIPYGSRPQQRWTWDRSTAPWPPASKLSDFSSISASALHPDGRTIFVSIRNTYSNERYTFSLDTESGEWTHHGDWFLPFSGEAQYDADLDAWVGIRKVYDKDGYESEHFCSCDVPVLSEGSTPALTWKVGEEMTSFPEPSIEFVFTPAVLIPMGCGGMFCLVQGAVRPGVTPGRSIGDGDHCLLRVTMFRAMYGKNGELVTSPLLYGRTYLT